MAAPRLRPVPARRRAIAAVRVSKERDNMTSPEIQRHIIGEFAARENVEIVEWIEGIDESGSRKKSAWWARLSYGCDRIEAGAADLLIVWRVDRTARNRLKWAVTEDRIETAGGLILSATEPNDQSPAGRFGRGVMVEHAVFIAASIGATWKETQERRVRHGLSPNGARHYGYTYTRADGYQIDPIEGPNLAAMYRAYTAGEAAWEIAQRYSSPDATPGADGAHARYSRWNTASILRLLDSGFGAGFVLFRGDLHPGAHQPVITADEWTRYQHARDARRRRPRAERSPYTYSGMIYCHCGSRMGGRTDHGRPRYACTDSAQYTRHPNASLAAHIIDDAVVEWLGEIRDELNAAARSAPRRPRLVEDPTKEIARRIASVTERLDAATLKVVDGTIPDDAYQRIRARLEAEHAELSKELTRHAAQQTVHPVAFVGDLVAQWPDLPVARRREALRLLVDRIDVGQPTDSPRVRITSALTRS
jgi:DNA invertase Pin-like site-specific DNA recombinase